MACSMQTTPETQEWRQRRWWIAWTQLPLAEFDDWLLRDVGVIRERDIGVSREAARREVDELVLGS